MRTRGAALLVGGLAVWLGGSNGCIHHHHYPDASPELHGRSGGPPPHAPAHGYRRHQADGVELVYDGEIGVYLVVGRSGHYHDGRHYFRWVDGEWMMSVRLDGGWIVVSSNEVPTGLVARYAGKHKKAKHGPGPPPPAQRAPR